MVQDGEYIFGQTGGWTHVPCKFKVDKKLGKIAIVKGVEQYPISAGSFDLLQSMIPHKKMALSAMDSMYEHYKKEIPSTPLHYSPFVREWHRGLGVLAGMEKEQRMISMWEKFRDLSSIALQTDDAYRLRLQLLLTKIFNMNRMAFSDSELWWLSRRGYFSNFAPIEDELSKLGFLETAGQGLCYDPIKEEPVDDTLEEPVVE